METDEVVLLLFGNFNPITNMHLRMFEVARDYLTDIGFQVYRGIVSPFEKNSNERNMTSMEHRIAMIRCALISSDWIQLSSGHCERFDLPTISSSLQHHQSKLEFMLRNNVDGARSFGSLSSTDTKIVVKLLCGADIFLCLKNSEAVDELHNILINHGIVVISRTGFDVESIVYESDTFWMHRKNIFIVRDQVENQITSRKIRKAVARGRSIKYLVSGSVQRYIQNNGLYTASDNEYTLSTSKTDDASQELIDSFHEFTWHSSQSCDYTSSSDTLTCTLPKKSKLLQRNRAKSETHFKNIDRSKLIEIPLTKDGVIQIIADKETNL